MKRFVGRLFNGLAWASALFWGATLILGIRAGKLPDSIHWDQNHYSSTTYPADWRRRQAILSSDVDGIAFEFCSDFDTFPFPIETHDDSSLRPEPEGDNFAYIQQQLPEGNHFYAGRYPLLAPNDCSTNWCGFYFYHYHSRGFQLQIYFAMPYWGVTGLLLFFPAIRIAMWKRRRHKLRLADKICIDCGYDLRATCERCPECGSAIKTMG